MNDATYKPTSLIGSDFEKSFLDGTRCVHSMPVIESNRPISAVPTRLPLSKIEDKCRVEVIENFAFDTEELDLNDTQVGDDGLVHLKGMSVIKKLWLKSTKVSDAGLLHLKGLSELRELDVSDTRFSDTGLVHLTDMPQLGIVHALDTRFTYEGRKKFEKARKDKKLTFCFVVPFSVD